MIPPRVILVAVDFSEPSRTALGFAARLARQTGAALHVLYAEDPLLSQAARRAGIDLGRDTSEELARFLGAARPAPDASTATHVVTGPAVEAIVGAAARLGVDLVVVASHGMSGAERLVFGSTTEGLLRTAPTSVLVTPGGWTAAPQSGPDLSGMGPILAAVDLSSTSAGTVRAACRLAAAIGTTVEILHVVADLPVLARWRAHAESAVGERTAAAREALQALERESVCDVPTRVRVELGAVPNRLVDAAEPSDQRRPILVLGRRSPGQGAAPGSTAYRVLSLTSVPVLMHVDPA